MKKLSKWLRNVLEIPEERVSAMDAFSPPVTPDPEDTKRLEERWQERRTELAGWQPTNGWLIWDPNDDR